MRSKEEPAPDERAEAEYADFDAATYETVKADAGESFRTIFEEDNPQAWIESDVYCDLESVA